MEFMQANQSVVDRKILENILLQLSDKDRKPKFERKSSLINDFVSIFHSII